MPAEKPDDSALHIRACPSRACLFVMCAFYTSTLSQSQLCCKALAVIQHYKPSFVSPHKGRPVHGVSGKRGVWNDDQGRVAQLRPHCAPISGGWELDGCRP